MEGLLLKLSEDRTGTPGRWFWPLFEPIRQDLDRLFWCMAFPPWMGSPDEFQQDTSATIALETEGLTSTELWRPGTLGRYAEKFAEEWIDLWGIDPAIHDPQRVASLYTTAVSSEMDHVIQPYAQAWLLYTDSTCWEIYARERDLLRRVRAHVTGKGWVEAFESDAYHRETAFRSADLAGVWLALHGLAEPGAPPNGGPSAPDGSSAGSGGPPSVS